MSIKWFGPKFVGNSNNVYRTYFSYFFYVFYFSCFSKSLWKSFIYANVFLFGIQSRFFMSRRRSLMSIEYITRARSEWVSGSERESERDWMSVFGSSYAFRKIYMYSIKNFAKITQIPF